jgi:hypothetical protein
MSASSSDILLLNHDRELWRLANSLLSMLGGFGSCWPSAFHRKLGSIGITRGYAHMLYSVHMCTTSISKADAQPGNDASLRALASGYREIVGFDFMPYGQAQEPQQPLLRSVLLQKVLEIFNIDRH